MNTHEHVRILGSASEKALTAFSTKSGVLNSILSPQGELPRAALRLTHHSVITWTRQPLWTGRRQKDGWRFVAHLAECYASCFLSDRAPKYKKGPWRGTAQRIREHINKHHAQREMLSPDRKPRVTEEVTDTQCLPLVSTSKHKHPK